jgi:hypothetical protein
MEHSNSPLKKYKRQPKLYVTLPSGGTWYPTGSLEKFEDLEVYSMTAGDEISVKTPDALYSGISVVKLIQNCIPGIKDAWYVPIIDLDYILAAIRLASYGETVALSGKCPHCSETSDYAIAIQTILDHMQNIQFVNEVRVNDFIFKLRPLYYKEANQLTRESYSVQRMLRQFVSTIDDETKQQEELSKLYDRLNEMTKSVVFSSVVEVVTPDNDVERHAQFIREFLENGDKEYYNAIKEVFDQNNDRYQIPKTTVSCGSCTKEYSVIPALNYTDFFS